MEIMTADSYGHVRVAARGKVYDYFGMGEYEVKKLKGMIRRGCEGAAWAFLKAFSRPEFVTPEVNTEKG